MIRRRRDARDGLIALSWGSARRCCHLLATRAPLALWLAILVVACPIDGRGADIPTAPILRIEAGMHGASINGIAVDEADQQLVSVSDDKTVRIWSIADGQLLATGRPPIGSGQ